MTGEKILVFAETSSLAAVNNCHRVEELVEEVVFEDVVSNLINLVEKLTPLRVVLGHARHHSVVAALLEHLDHGTAPRLLIRILLLLIALETGMLHTFLI